MDATRRRTFLRIAGWMLAAVIIAIVGYRLIGDLRQLRDQPLEGNPRWDLIALSGVVFLAAHAVLVQTWLSVLSCWDARLPFWSAARIWSVSNLGKYLPGKVWQIGAMGAMSRELGVSAIAATGSAILGAIVNVATGLVVVLISGRPLLDQLLGNHGDLATAAIVAGVAALVGSPWIIPRVAPLVAKLTGRTVDATLPARAIVYSLVGNVVAWLLYGYAFKLFAGGMLRGTTGGYSAYLAAYTFSYVAGYVALFAPAGAGVREGFMLTALTFAGLATAPQAALVTITSRVWLTILEVTPGFLFWAHHRARRRKTTTHHLDVPT